MKNGKALFVGRIYTRSGFVRQILSIQANSLQVKTIGVPAYRPVGRPPINGTIKVDSFRRWANKEYINKKTQLLI